MSLLWSSEKIATTRNFLRHFFFLKQEIKHLQKQIPSLLLPGEDSCHVACVARRRRKWRRRRHQLADARRHWPRVFVLPFFLRREFFLCLTIMEQTCKKHRPMPRSWSIAFRAMEPSDAARRLALLFDLFLQRLPSMWMLGDQPCIAFWVGWSLRAEFLL